MDLVTDRVLAVLLLVAKIVLLLAGLLLPGVALARAFRVSPSVATSFAGSAVSLYSTVLVLQFASVRISLGSLTVGLSAIALTALTIARLRKASAQPESLRPPLSRAEHQTLTSYMGAWTPVYLLFWAAVFWRAWHEPLAGPDIEFRWSFLAEQMLRIGSLDFYPPRSADDYVFYFWAESIPPGASALHAWAYACAGGAKAAWTVPAVVLQLWAIHELLWRTARSLGGIVAARLACLAAAACPMLTWSVLIGQETGLTALSLIGMAFALQRWSEARAAGWAALAGIFAVLGASAREYGLVFPALGVAALIALRADRRAWLGFVLLASVSLAWPFQTWLLTSNPFYSLPLGGIFPVNERFLAWIEYDASFLGSVLHSTAGWRQIARYLLSYAPFAVLGWLVLMTATARGRGRAAGGLAATALVLGLWATSVPYTNGGVFYSLRVASPAFALGALAAGIGTARFIEWRPRVGRAVPAVFALLAVVLLPATLALPRNPWRTPPIEWPGFGEPIPPASETTDETVELVLRVMSTSPADNANSHAVVLADSPGFQRRFLSTGVNVVPLWSPQADWLFERQLPPAEAARLWRESGVSHIIITKWKPNLDFFNGHSRWGRPPFQVELVGETKLTAVFAIREIE